MVGDSPLQCLVLDLKENKLLAILHPKVSAPWKTHGWGLHFLHASSVLASNHAPCAHFFPFHFQKERKGKKEKKREKNYLFTVRWVSKGCGLSILGDIQTLDRDMNRWPSTFEQGIRPDDIQRFTPTSAILSCIHWWQQTYSFLGGEG